MARPSFTHIHRHGTVSDTAMFIHVMVHTTEMLFTAVCIIPSSAVIAWSNGDIISMHKVAFVMSV